MREIAAAASANDMLLHASGVEFAETGVGCDEANDLGEIVLGVSTNLDDGVLLGFAGLWDPARIDGLVTRACDTGLATLDCLRTTKASDWLRNLTTSALGDAARIGDGDLDAALARGADSRAAASAAATASEAAAKPFGSAAAAAAAAAEDPDKAGEDTVTTTWSGNAFETLEQVGVVCRLTFNTGLGGSRLNSPKLTSVLGTEGRLGLESSPASHDEPCCWVAASATSAALCVILSATAPSRDGLRLPRRSCGPLEAARKDIDETGDVSGNGGDEPSLLFAVAFSALICALLAGTRSLAPLAASFVPWACGMVAVSEHSAFAQFSTAVGLGWSGCDPVSDAASPQGFERESWLQPSPPPA